MSIVDETTGLLGKAPSRLRRISHYFHDEVTTRGGDLLLLICYVITGLLDSSAVFVWGSFVSMQTGNTVYFGLGLIGSDDDRWIKSGVSICSFCIGSVVFAAFHRTFSPRERWVLCTSFFLQLCCVTFAAVVVTICSPTRDTPLCWLVLVPIALVAFQSSGQAVTSRVLSFNGLTSVVLTSIYCDLFSNPTLLSTSVFGNIEQRRRIGAVISLFLGVLLGGLWSHSEAGVMGALWTAVFLKAFVFFAWLVWKKKVDDHDE